MQREYAGTCRALRRTLWNEVVFLETVNDASTQLSWAHKYWRLIDICVWPRLVHAGSCLRVRQAVKDLHRDDSHVGI